MQLHKLHEPLYYSSVKAKPWLRAACTPARAHNAPSITASRCVLCQLHHADGYLIVVVKACKEVGSEVELFNRRSRRVCGLAS